MTWNKVPKTIILCKPSWHLLIQIDNRNTRAMCVICSKLRIETAERRNAKYLKEF